MQKYIDEELIRYVESRPRYAWDFKKLCKRVDVTSEFIKKYAESGNLCVTTLTRNPKFQFSWVVENPNLDWNPTLVSDHVYLCDILEHPEYPWNWARISMSTCITISDMVSYPNLPWNFHNWGWERVGYDELRIIRTFRDKFNRSDYIDYTAHAPWDIIKTNLDIQWVPTAINFAYATIVSPSDITAIRYLYEKEPFGFHVLSRIAHIDLILSSVDLPWEWTIISARQDIDYDDLKLNVPWNWNYTPTKSKDYLIKEWKSAIKIQKIFRGMKARRIFRDSKLYKPGGDQYNLLIEKYAHITNENASHFCGYYSHVGDISVDS